MPIIVRHTSAGDLGNLAVAAGHATGAAERRVRQEAYDQRFISEAIAASRARNTGPSYFERESAGHAAEAYATQRNQAQLDAAADATAAEREVGLARAAANVYEADAKFAADSLSARANADQIAHRRGMFQAAASMGPEALQAFLAEDAFATGKSPVPTGYLEGVAGTKGKGPDQKRDVSSFQRLAEGLITGGQAAQVLPYAGERDNTAFDPMNPEAKAPLSTKALETIAALQHTTGTMNQSELRALRAQLASAPATEEVKQGAIKVVDEALIQRQKMRDVEVSQVYDNVLRDVTQKITTDEKFAAMPRAEQRALVGAQVARTAASYGVSPSELERFLSNVNNTPAQPAPR